MAGHCTTFAVWVVVHHLCLVTWSIIQVKAAKYEIQKPSTCRATGATLLGGKLWVWCKTSHKTKIMLEVDLRSTFRNNFLQPTRKSFFHDKLITSLRKQPSFFAPGSGGALGPVAKKDGCFRRLVDHSGWKTRNIDPKLATKQCCATSWEFLYLVFRRL